MWEKKEEFGDAACVLQFSEKKALFHLRTQNHISTEQIQAQEQTKLRWLLMSFY